MDNIYCFSGKLSVSSDTVQHGVEGLIYLLTESSKLMVRAFVGPWTRVKAEKVGRDVFWRSDYRTGGWSKCGR